MDIATLKSTWNEILNDLERVNRVAWLAYFDGRLAKLESDILYLDFSDQAKFAGNHDFATVRKDEHRKALEDAIFECTGHQIEVREI